MVPITPADVERQRLTSSDDSWDTRTVAASYRRELSADVVVDLASGQVPHHECGDPWRGLVSLAGCMP